MTFWTRAIRVARELAPVTQRQLAAVLRDMEDRLRREIVTAADQKFDDVLVRLAARLGVLQAENASAQESVRLKDAALSAANELIASLRGELDGERASRAAEVARLVSEAMALDAQRDLERVGAILVAAGGELPNDVPEVETPPAGEPATPPTDTEVEVEPVDEGSLPETQIPEGSTVTPEQPAGETAPTDTPSDSAAGEQA